MDLNTAPRRTGFTSLPRDQGEGGQPIIPPLPPCLEWFLSFTCHAPTHPYRLTDHLHHKMIFSTLEVFLMACQHPTLLFTAHVRKAELAHEYQHLQSRDSLQFPKESLIYLLSQKMNVQASQQAKTTNSKPQVANLRDNPRIRRLFSYQHNLNSLIQARSQCKGLFTITAGQEIKPMRWNWEINLKKLKKGLQWR